MSIRDLHKDYSSVEQQQFTDRSLSSRVRVLFGTDTLFYETSEPFKLEEVGIDLM